MGVVGREGEETWRGAEGDSEEFAPHKSTVGYELRPYRTMDLRCGLPDPAHEWEYSLYT
jgi:hypothetical protein